MTIFGKSVKPFSPFVCVTFFALSVFSCATVKPSAVLPETPEKSFQSLVAAERAFAAHSDTAGHKKAFLANLADSGILFRPGPINGKKWYQNQESSSGNLRWEPEYALVSSSGDLGFTTGPFSFQPNEKPCENKNNDCSYGYYLSVWERTNPGVWKVAIDYGTRMGHKDTLQHPDVVSFITRDTTQKVIPTDSTSISDILEIEESWQDTSKTDKWIFNDRMVSSMHKQARIYRVNQHPRIVEPGNKDFEWAISGTAGWPTIEPYGGKMADAGDLAYTYGLIMVYNSNYVPYPEPYYYLNIWVRDSDGSWKIILNLANRQPKMKN